MSAGSSGIAACAPTTLNLELVIREHGQFVRAVASRFLAAASDVDDVTQEVFAGAARRLHELREPTAVRAWLARVAVRAALRRRRVERRHAANRSNEGELSRYPAGGPTPEERVMLLEAWQILLHLPRQHRGAWIMRRVERESVERIAAADGCSSSTAKRRIGVVDEALARAFRDP